MRRPAAWVAIAGLVVYVFLLRLAPLELLRATAGVTALWGPVTVLVFAALRREVPERLPRAAFALIAGYAITTLLYFACCVVYGPALFYVVYGLLAAAAVGLIFIFRTAIVAAWTTRRIDWTLLAILSLTLVAFARYQHPYETERRTMDVSIITSPDQTYFCAQAYELARTTPPTQQACQAGLPERAYHLFPHLAAMLTSRFAGQPDLMRAHMAYNYAVLATLSGLALYVIASRLASSRRAGYFAAASLVLFAIPMPALLPDSPAYLGFTLLPLATSLTEPTFITSPQMFAGLTVTFGVLVGIALICQRLRDGRPYGLLAIFCGLLVATLLRFRAHVFIPLFPGFLAVLAYLWFRSPPSRRRPVVVAAAVTVTGALLLFLEMRRANYLHDSASVVLGFHPNYRPFMDSWPLADAVRRALWPASSTGIDAGPAWQAFSILAFVTLNVIGLPLLIAWAVWIRRPDSWRPWGPYTFLTAWLVLASIAGSLFVTSAYDPYALGGQMLLHTGWYILPLLAVGVWRFTRRLRARTTWSLRTWTRLGWTLLVAATLTQAMRGFSPLERFNWRHGVVMTWNEWLAATYLHDRTPADAVVLANGPIEPEFSWAVLPAVTGRASYLTYTEITSTTIPQATGRTDVGKGRQAIIDAIWRTTSPERFASLVAATGADYLVEFSSRPLSLSPPSDVLREVWASPASGMIRVRIFRILPAMASESP